jgi:hypothetical protein
MGRTQPTFRRLLDQLYVDWADFRRALRGEEREAFDALFRRAKNHASAAQLVPEPEPLHALLLAVLVEHERELRALQERSPAVPSPTPRRPPDDDGGTGDG